jgi:hypothetical protein
VVSRCFSHSRNFISFRYREMVAFTATSGSEQTCSNVANAAAAGEYDLEMCAYSAARDAECGCPERPDTTTTSRCSICPDTQVLIPYVLFFNPTFKLGCLSCHSSLKLAISFLIWYRSCDNLVYILTLFAVAEILLP